MFGKRLSKLRKSRKLSQEELAKLVGTHTNVLGRYEREDAKPSIDIVINLSKVLNVSLDYLLGMTDTIIDDEILNKLTTIQNLPSNDKEHILFTIDALLRDAKVRTAYS